jgi:Leucine-rich repeat (LRR) protein
LDFNKVGKNILKVAEAAKANPRLEEVTLRNADISTKEVHEFLAALGNCQTLKRIALEKNELDKNVFLEKLKPFPRLTFRV